MTTTISSHQWSLVALSPQLGDLSVPLGMSTSVGRHPDNDIVLASQQISRHHAKFNQIGSTLVVQDLGSSNGTFVNGQRIATEAVELKEDDEVGFADILFVVANEVGSDTDSVGNLLEGDLHDLTTLDVKSDPMLESKTEAVTEVVSLPPTTIAHTLHSEPIQSEPTKSTVDQAQPNLTKTPAIVETVATPATVTAQSQKAIEDTVSEPITSQPMPKTLANTNSISEPKISPITPINNAAPVIPKKASTQTWLVAIIIVILIVLAIIGTLFLK